jgi:rubrerythrin
MSRINLALVELGYEPEKIDLENLPASLSLEKIFAAAGIRPVEESVEDYVGDIWTCQSCGYYADALLVKACPRCGGFLG